MTDDINYGRDKLPYPYSFATKIVKDFDFDYSVNEDRQYQGTDFFILVLSENQRLNLLSSAVTGSGIVFPDDDMNTIAPLLQALDYPNDVPPQWISMICNVIAECIDNSQAVQDALAKYLANELSVPNNNSQTIINNQNNNGNLLEGLSCDLDTVYGVAVAIEDYLFATARDIWEVVLDTSVDSISKLRLVDYAPIVGDLPVIDDINDLISQIRLFGLTAFDIGYNTSIRQDNICALFELACADCELSPQQVAFYYASQALPSYDIEDQFDAFVKILITGTFTEELVVKAWMGFVASVLATGGGVLQYVGINGFNKVALTGNPDSDWAVFCDPCATLWCNFVDFTIEQGDYIILSGTRNASGVVGSFVPIAQFFQSTILKTMPSTVVTEVTFEITTQDGDTVSSNNDKTLILRNGGSIVHTETINPTSDGTYTFFVPDIAVDDLRLIVRAKGGSGGFINLKNVTVRGQGVDPYILGVDCS